MHILKKVLWLTVLVMLVAACAPTIETAPAAPAAGPTPVPVDQAEGVDLRVEVGEAFVANLLGEQLAEPIPVPGQDGVEITIVDPVFDLVPSDLAKLTATLDLDVYGVVAEARPTISLRITAEDGQINVSVAGVSLGDVSYPMDAVADQMAGVEAQVRDQLVSTLQGLTDATGLQVQSILITDDALVLDLGR
ncbi:MAG: hypothetical protein R2873_21100 [Caldilineaceae bacterium]